MKRCFATLMMAVIAIGSVGCVSQTGMDTANEQIRVRDEQIATLKQRIEDLNGEVEILRGHGEDAAALRLALAGSKTDIERYKSLLADARQRILDMAEKNPTLPKIIDEALKQLAEQNPGLMTYDSERGMIRFASDLTFDLGKATVKPGAAASLQQLAGIINSPLAQTYDVRIEGHTDNVPMKNADNLKKYEDNWGLSAFRAIAVQRVLKSSGIAPQRMIVSGRGEFNPLVANDPKGTRANRRVEIYLVPSGREQAAPPAGNTGTVTDSPGPETGTDDTPPPPETFK